MIFIPGNGENDIYIRQGMEVAKQSPEKVEEAAVDHILEDRLPERRKVSWRGPGCLGFQGSTMVKNPLANAGDIKRCEFHS